MGIATEINDSCVNIGKIETSKGMEEPDTTTVYGLNMTVRQLTAKLDLVLAQLDFLNEKSEQIKLDVQATAVAQEVK